MHTELQARTVQHLLDIEWHIAIQEQLADNPAGVAFSVEPACLGQYMAELGQPCEPTKYYTRLGDVEAFIIAYNDTAALWAEMVQAKNDDLAADTFDYDGALLELLDGIAEDEFNRRGC